MGFIKDLFSFRKADFTNVESLSLDIERLADERYANLLLLFKESTFEYLIDGK